MRVLAIAAACTLVVAMAVWIPSTLPRGAERAIPSTPTPPRRAPTGPASDNPDITAATHILSRAERGAIAGVTDSTVTFDAPPSSLDHVAIDTILVSEPAARAPAGMLRRVTAVRRDGQTLVVDTVHAAITDAVINGSFGFGTPVPLEPVEPTRGPDG